MRHIVVSIAITDEQYQQLQAAAVRRDYDAETELDACVVDFLSERIVDFDSSCVTTTSSSK